MNVDIGERPLLETLKPGHACAHDCRYFQAAEGDSWGDSGTCLHPGNPYRWRPVRVGLECPRFEPVESD